MNIMLETDKERLYWWQIFSETYVDFKRYLSIVNFFISLDLYVKFYLQVKIEWGELPTSPKGIVYTPIVIQIFFSYLAKIEYNCCSLNFRQWTNSPFSLLFSEDRIHLNFVRKFIRENVLLKTTIFIVNFLYTFLK